MKHIKLNSFIKAVEEKRVLGIQDFVGEFKLSIIDGEVLCTESEIWISEEMIY